MVFHPSHELGGGKTKLCQLCGHCACCTFDKLTIPCTNTKENTMTIDAPETKLVNDIPDQIEEMFYRMNPETDDILENGSLLENGMIVLAEDSMLRENAARALRVDVNTGELDDVHAFNRALSRNRWCRVSQVRCELAFDRNHPQVTFIAEYADGSKEKRRYAKDYAWLVKIDSLPSPT